MRYVQTIFTTTIKQLQRRGTKRLRRPTLLTTWNETRIDRLTESSTNRRVSTRHYLSVNPRTALQPLDVLHVSLTFSGELLLQSNDLLPGTQLLALQELFGGL